MRAKVYIETTIPSYLAGRPSRDLLVAAHQQTTRDWWEVRRPLFDLFVSQAVLEESGAGDPAVSKKRIELLANIPVLPYTEMTKQLTASFIREGSIPVRASSDAVHIAVATVYECEYLLTWNCAHIANAQIQRRIRAVVRENGFEPPVICTPEELMGDEDALSR
jgi:hypothetical protein